MAKLDTSPHSGVRFMGAVPSITVHDGLVIVVEANGASWILSPSVAEEIAQLLSKAALAAELGRSEVIFTGPAPVSPPFASKPQAERPMRGSPSPSPPASPPKSL